MKNVLSIIWKRLKNKYVISTILFLLFYFFLGENNRMVIMRLNREVNNLKREASLIEKDIKQDSLEAASLFASREALEAYGREHYYMKRPNEDIFIIKDEKK